MTQHDQHIAAWRDAFRDETTGIHRAIQDLLWNYAAFRTTVRIVRLANEKRGSRPPLNQMMFNLVSEGYWSSLLLGTRRLLDKAPIKGPKGVYSIRSVVNDVKASQNWLTRRIYVEASNIGGLPDWIAQESSRYIAAKIARLNLLLNCWIPFEPGNRDEV